MPPIRNSCVARGSAPAGANTTVYTVPTSNVFLFKSAVFFNPGAATAQVSIGLIPASGAGAVNLGANALASNGSLIIQTWVAMNAGDAIYIGCTGSATSYWLSGATLPFVPGF